MTWRARSRRPSARWRWPPAARWGEAERCARRAQDLSPDDASFRFNLAIIELVRGNFVDGWLGHEARWQGSSELRGGHPALNAPRWRGEPLAGKTLLVWGEQGMDDLLQLCRSIPLLAEHVHREGGRLAWNSFPQMGELLSRSLGAHVDLYSQDVSLERLPAADYQLPIGSVPWQLGLPDAVSGASASRPRRGPASACGSAWPGPAARATSAIRSAAWAWSAMQRPSPASRA